MKTIFFFTLILCLFLTASGCQSNVKDTTTPLIQETTITDAVQNHSSYIIQTVIDLSDDGKKSIEYPQLCSRNNDYTTINSLLHSELVAWLKGVVDDDAAVNLSYAVTFSDDLYICVLFEGSVTAPNVAHPTNIVHSVCVSLIEGIIVDPLENIEINDDFVGRFKNVMLISRDTGRYTEEQWETVVAYFQTFSDDELKQMIVNGEIGLIEDGVMICIVAPHVIGDYIKVTVKNTA